MSIITPSELNCLYGHVVRNGHQEQEVQATKEVWTEQRIGAM